MKNQTSVEEKEICSVCAIDGEQVLATNYYFPDIDRDEKIFVCDGHISVMERKGFVVFNDTAGVEHCTHCGDTLTFTEEKGWTHSDGMVFAEDGHEVQVMSETEVLRQIPPARVEYLYAPEVPPAVCPLCGSNDIRSDGDDYPELIQEVKDCLCHKCGFEWEETFDFRRWEPKR